MKIKTLEALIQKTSLIDASHKKKLITKLTQLSEHSIESLISVLTHANQAEQKINTDAEKKSIQLIREYESVLADFDTNIVPQLLQGDETKSQKEDEAILADILKDIDQL